MTRYLDTVPVSVGSWQSTDILIKTNKRVLTSC